MTLMNYSEVLLTLPKAERMQLLAEVVTALKAQTTPTPDVAQWIHNCITIEDPQQEPSIIPFHLWPAQVDALAALESSRQLIVLKARQLGMTWLVLARELHRCIYHANKTIIVISKDQDAAGEMIRRVRGMYMRLADKPAGVTLTIDNVGEIAWSNGSRVKAFASTSDASSSFTGSLLILDELAKNRNADDIYTAAKPTIDDGGAVVILSTAKGRDNLFHRLWDKAQAGANNLRPVFIPWHARPGRDDAWYERTAADAVSLAHHRQEYPATSDEAFQSLADTPFIPDIGYWDACREDLPPLDAREPIVVALDAATSNDSFGLVVVSRHPARPAEVAVRRVHEWRPVNGVIRFGAANEPDTPRGVVEMLIRDFNVIQLCGDPYQLHQMFTEIRDDGRVYVAEFGQTVERLEADNQLRQLILARKLAHDGSETLRRHIQNADAKVDEEAHKLRIIKRESSLKIDTAVACSMAVKRCLDLAL